MPQEVFLVWPTSGHIPAATVHWPGCSHIATHMRKAEKYFPLLEAVSTVLHVEGELEVS